VVSHEGTEFESSSTLLGSKMDRYFFFFSSGSMIIKKKKKKPLKKQIQNDKIV
jgi:hypothetical protein